MDRFRIDSHKLIYHVPRVSRWLEGRSVFPIYLEIATSGACNHRCTYCALDFMEYRPRFLDSGVLRKRLYEMGSLGVKSIMYAGEGEPLLHKDMANIIKHTGKAGIDVALTTNGVLLDKKLADNVLGDLSWVKVSINGAKKETYAKIHRCRPGDFDTVVKNMAYMAGLRKRKGYGCALGAQLLLIPDNRNEAIILARIVRDIGLDYLVIKPYSHHPSSRTSRYKNIRYGGCLEMADKMKKLNTDKFNIVFRIDTMKKWDDGIRNYRHCYALPFWSYIDAGGDVWGCSAHLGKKEFLYGNIMRNTFEEIWGGRRKRQAVRMAERKLMAEDCRVNCRMDEVNRYLWNLKNPVEHVNFI